MEWNDAACRTSAHDDMAAALTRLLESESLKKSNHVPS
jgi:hypothetical protein